MTLIIGIDTSSGAKSETGYSVFNAETKEIISAESFAVPKAYGGSLHYRVRFIAGVMEDAFMAVLNKYPAARVYCYIESTVMRGKGGESLARATGAVLAACPYSFEQEFISNSTVKMLVGGHGRAEKGTVAAGVLDWFSGNALVAELIEQQKWDALDSLAIGIAGWMRENHEG